MRPNNNKPTLANTLLNFTKVEHTIFSLPLLFAGMYLGASHRWPSLGVILLIVLAGIGARVLGMATNRIFDRKLDALNPRTAARELPAGKMSLTTAGLVALAGFLVYLVACIGLGPACTMLAPIPAIALIGYSLLKRVTSLCHFGIGLSMAFAPLGAYVAGSQLPIDQIEASLQIILLAVFAFCWISGFDIIYALQDIDSDRNNGVFSLPAKLGAPKAQLVAALVHLVGLACLAGLITQLQTQLVAWIAFGIALIAEITAYLPQIPLEKRFFPISAVAGIAGACVPLLGTLV